MVYNKYIKINLPDTEIAVAEYAMTKSVDIFVLYIGILDPFVGFYDSNGYANPKNVRPILLVMNIPHPEAICK